MAEAQTPSAHKTSRWSADDEETIKRVIHDYFEGWFEGDATRMKRALHPGLAKQSLSKDEGSTAIDTITAQEMIDAAAAGVGTKYEPEKRGFTVDIVDVYETIACAVVYSDVYREYVCLVRGEKTWRIASTLWRPVREQSPT